MGGALALAGVVPLLGMGVQVERKTPCSGRAGSEDELKAVLTTASNKFVCSLSERPLPSSTTTRKEQTFDESIFSWYICVRGWAGISHNKIQASYSRVFATQADWCKKRSVEKEPVEKHSQVTPAAMGRRLLFSKKKKVCFLCAAPARAPF